MFGFELAARNSGRVRRRVTLYRASYKAAIQYHKAAEMIYGKVVEDGLIHQSAIFPTITLLGFACELYTKAVLYYYSSVPIRVLQANDKKKWASKWNIYKQMNHDLGKMYTLFPQNIKVEILSEFSSKRYSKSKLYTKELFEERLKNAAQSFVGSRYGYEKEINCYYSGFLLDYAMLLATICRRVYKGSINK